MAHQPGSHGCARHGGDPHHSCADHMAPGPPPASQSLAEVEFARSACKAAQEGDLARLGSLLARDPGAAHSDGRGGTSGYTPLHYAARGGHAACVRALLAAGADPSAATAAGGATPLHRAAYMGHAGVVRALLEAGAGPDARDADGETPLHKAARGGHAGACRALLPAARRSLGLRERRGRTPLEVAREGSGVAEALASGGREPGGSPAGRDPG